MTVYGRWVTVTAGDTAVVIVNAEVPFIQPAEVNRPRKRSRFHGERLDMGIRLHCTGDYMSNRRTAVAVAGMLTALALPAAAQQSVAQADSASAQIRTVLRTFYFNLAHQDWQALSADVLSPKILERRTAPGGLHTASRGRARFGGSPRAAAEPAACSSSTSPVVDQAAIRLDGDWAEVSVPRCSVASPGTDEFRLLYLEERWRFIYIDLFEEPTNVSTGR